MAAPALGAAALTARHDHNLDSQKLRIETLAEKSLKALKDGDITQEEHDELMILRDQSIDAASDYLKSITEYKTTSGLWHPFRKLSKVRRVRERKRRLREQTSDFESHYASSISSSSASTSSTHASRRESDHRVEESQTDDMFSDAEEVPSVDSPFEVEKSLAKIFPQIASLFAEHRRTLSRPSTSSIKTTSLHKKFHRELEVQKTYYDQQLHHVAMEFIEFYAKNFQDDFGDTESRQGELQMLFGLIVAAIALGEMSVAQLASQPEVVVSILQRLQEVEEVKDRYYQDAGWLDHIQDLITSLDSVFRDFLRNNERDSFNNIDSEEFLGSGGFYGDKNSSNFVSEPAVALLLSPSQLTQANQIVRQFANELLECGSVFLELSQLGDVMSATSKWRKNLGITGSRFLNSLTDTDRVRFRAVLSDPPKSNQTVEIRFKLKNRQGKLSPWLEGRGITIYHRVPGTAIMRTMWFIKQCKAENDTPLFMSNHIVQCPLCQYAIPLWYIRTHCEACVEVHRLQTAIEEVNKSLERNRIEVYLESLPKIFHSKEKKCNRKVLREIHDILQAALEVPTPSPIAHDAELPPSPFSLKPEILRLRTWFPTSSTSANETKLNECLLLAQDTMREKVDNITLMLNIIRYSQLVWKESTPPWKSLRLDSLKNVIIRKRLHVLSKAFLIETKPQGQYYVIKVVPKMKMVRKNRVNPDRMAILQRPGEPSFVAKLYAAFQSKTNLYLVMTFIGGGDCAALNKPLDEIRTKEYIADVVLAIGFLHQENIVHRDLKPDNLLIDSSSGHIKLTDSGINLNLKKLYIDHVRDSYRANYLAPEVIRQVCLESDRSIDWWALGVIMHEFLYGIRPFAADLTVKILNNIVLGQINSDNSLNNMLSEEALDFMNRLLTLSPEKRLGYGGVEEVKNHGFFTGTNWNILSTS